MPYCDPPKHSQFKPRESGNRNGRPKGAKGRKQILERIAYELCEVRIGGQVRLLPRLEILLMAIRNATANGNPAAQKLYDKLLNEAHDDDADPPIPKGVFISGEKLTVEEWDAEFAHLDGRSPTPPCRKRGIVVD